MIRDINKPVEVKAKVLEGRPDLAHYKGQKGVVYWTSEEYALIIWRGLHCSSLWAIRDLVNVERSHEPVHQN